MTLRVVRLLPTAVLPRRAEAGSVGYDLCAAEVRTIEPGGRAPVRTGVAAAIRPGCYGRIAPRSGLAVKQGIDVLAGVVDPSYRGELLAVLQNHGTEPFHITPGMRIAQLIIERCETPEVREVEALDETERGAAGFGSSGV